MRNLIFAAILAAGFPFCALAKSYSIPDDDPIATIALPDNWDADDLDAGIEVTSPDENVYVAVEAQDLLDVRSATAAAFRFFDEKGISIDQSSQKEREFDIGGMKAFELAFRGKDEDGPTNVSLTVVAVSDKKVLMVTYWASDEGEKMNADSLSAMVNSIQATKK